MNNIALITGITGQDGSYLAEFLLEKGYEVHGLIRRHSIYFSSNKILPTPWRLMIKQNTIARKHIINLMRIIGEIRPTEGYNLAAQSHVGVSFEVPEYTADATGVSTLKLLEAIRVNGGNCRYYHQPHSLNIIACITPVTLCIHITKRNLLLFKSRVLSSGRSGISMGKSCKSGKGIGLEAQGRF